MATIHNGSTIVWSDTGLAIPTTASVGGSAVSAGILQSMSKTTECSSKTMTGASGETVSDVLYNTRHALSFEIIPTARAAFPAIGTVIYAPNANDMKGKTSRKYVLTGGSQNSTVDGETRYTFECESYDSLTVSAT